MVNIVVCGTPGTGKSTLIERLKPELTKFTFINLSQFSKDNDCLESYDESLETHVINEDKLIECLDIKLNEIDHNFIECIHADLVPEERVDWVFVCRTDNTILYDRLKARNYNELKISNNVQSEIFQTIYDEALECFGESIVTELVSNKLEDLETNMRTVLDKIKFLQEA